MTEPAVRTMGLTRRYGSRTAVADLDILVPRGAIVGLLGPNGAGKTTTLRMLTGLVAPTAGDAEVLGLDVRRHAAAIKARVAYQPQADALYGDLTAAENVLFLLRLHGVPRAERSRLTDEALRATGIGALAARPADRLSGGERRRLALACVIALRQELLILDEPTAGLDPVSREQVWDLLHALRRHGVTILVTTHHMDEADRCTHLGVLIDGRLRCQDTPEALRGSYPHALYEILPTPGVGPAALARALGAVHVTSRGSHLRIAVPGGDEDAVRAVAAAQELGSELRRVPPTLEDVYLELTGGAGEAA